MVVILCGGRKYSDYDQVKKVLDHLDSEGMTVLVSGGCTGADRLARRWAEERGYTPGPSRERPRVWHLIPEHGGTYKQYMEYPALWGTYGRSAGPIRNREMLEETRPDLVVAFPGHRGTADMKEQAKRRNVKVVEHG